tara:strand:+ start:2119 stop:2655 length:537 start_codon:yes stop_codon:yes gene_type:complete
MDISNYQKIKNYYNQIINFRKLDNYKMMSNSQFKNEMKVIYPKFSKKYNKLFDNIVNNNNLQILNIMFTKLDLINDEFNKRKNEVNVISDFINDAIILIKEKKLIKKKDLQDLFKKNKSKYKIDYMDFINKYSVIIDRLVDKDDNDYDPLNLLYKQIKFKYEIEIGKVLVNKYIKNKV